MTRFFLYRFCTFIFGSKTKNEKFMFILREQKRLISNVDDTCIHRMLRIFYSTPLTFILFAILGGAFSQVEKAAAADNTLNETKFFRVDSIVRMEKENEIIKIVSSSVFAEDAVFDFIGDNDEIIVYRWNSKIFTLIDPIHRVQTDLALSDIDLFLERIKVKLTEQKDKFNQTMLKPDFDISANESGDSLVFQSRYIDYAVKTRPFEDPTLTQKFYQISEALSKLNIYLNPGTTTPFARIVVNNALKEKGLFAERFDISVYPKGKWIFGKVVKIESEHKMVRRLSEKDKGRIVRAIHFSEQFPKIPFGRYQNTIQSVQ